MTSMGAPATMAGRVQARSTVSSARRSSLAGDIGSSAPAAVIRLTMAAA